ncbi:MAG: LuxR C-terminal-related transcriptional regulator, partial [Chloroflexota bacterium]|nr:LuxR C-terminal-related transcriptional regulator [Chloroflexota bacterium]
AGALQALDASRHDDLPVAIVVAASRALLSAGDEQVKMRTRARLAALVTMVAQRTVDDAVRARFFCGPLGRELAALGASEPSALAEGTPDGATHPTSSLDEDDSLLLGLLVEGRTNAEIASRVGVAEDEVVRRLGRLFAKLAASSRAEATAFALRDGLV